MKQSEEFNDDLIAEDALPVCPKCLKTYNPLQNYCTNCDSNEPINPLASYMPFVNIRFTAGMYGKIWKSLWDGKGTSFIVKLFYLLLITLGAPVIIIIGLPLFLISKIKNPRLRKEITIIFFILLFLLLMIYILYLCQFFSKPDYFIHNYIEI